MSILPFMRNRDETCFAAYYHGDRIIPDTLHVFGTRAERAAWIAVDRSGTCRRKKVKPEVAEGILLQATCLPGDTLDGVRKMGELVRRYAYIQHGELYSDMSAVHRAFG